MTHDMVINMFGALMVGLAVGCLFSVTLYADLHVYEDDKSFVICEAIFIVILMIGLYLMQRGY